MAKNEVYRLGQYVPLPVIDGTDSGDAVRVGILNGVAVTPKNTVEGEFGGHLGEAPVDLGGAFILPVTIAAGPLTAGQAIYITGAGVLTTVATGNTLFGAALEYNVPNGTGTPVTVKILN